MESKLRVKIVYSVPEVKFEVVTEAFKTTNVRKIDISNEQDCKKVEFVELDQGAFDNIQKSVVLAPVRSREGDNLILDLYKWTDPNVELKVGIQVPDFMKTYAESIDNLLSSEEVRFDDIKDKLP